MGMEPAGTTEFFSSACTSQHFVLRSFYVENAPTSGRLDNEKETAKWHNKRSSAKKSA